MKKQYRLENFLGAEIKDDKISWEKRNRVAEIVTKVSITTFALGALSLGISSQFLNNEALGWASAGLGASTLLLFLDAHLFTDKDGEATSIKGLVSIGYAFKNIVKTPFAKLKEFFKKDKEEQEIEQ